MGLPLILALSPFVLLVVDIPKVGLLSVVALRRCELVQLLSSDEAASGDQFVQLPLIGLLDILLYLFVQLILPSLLSTRFFCCLFAAFCLLLPTALFGSAAFPVHPSATRLRSVQTALSLLRSPEPYFRGLGSLALLLGFQVVQHLFPQSVILVNLVRLLFGGGLQQMEAFELVVFEEHSHRLLQKRDSSLQMNDV